MGLCLATGNFQRHPSWHVAHCTRSVLGPPPPDPPGLPTGPLTVITPYEAAGDMRGNQAWNTTKPPPGHLRGQSRCFPPILGCFRPTSRAEGHMLLGLRAGGKVQLGFFWGGGTLRIPQTEASCNAFI